ncbi:pilus assembly protein [Herbaspirillum sp.]|uniref:pilus assembly protein n=1 Tax=Herbaspirillum sp. TaxID=1890675 RepID=UPI0031DC3E32
MSDCPDSLNFALSPLQRRRARERTFYRWLAFAASLGILPVLALAMRIDAHTSGIGTANRLLQQELQALQPQLEQLAASQRNIAHMQSRLATLDRQAILRAQAASLLRAASSAARPEIRLYRIALQTGVGELRGHAAEMRDVQAYAEALRQAGMEGATLHELRALETHSGGGRYDFTLSLPLTLPPLDGPADADGRK